MVTLSSPPKASPTATDLLSFIHSSPTPRHCALETARRLADAGFAALHEVDDWKLEAGAGYYVVHGGSVVAFRVGRRPSREAGFRLLGAHTDSPNLRIKPLADVRRQGYHVLGVDLYGGLLEYTWLDRDLGLAGAVLVSSGDRQAGPAQSTAAQRAAVRRGAVHDGGVEERMVRIDRPLLRVPSLAIHLNREIRETGLKLNAQTHMPPLMAVHPSGEPIETPSFAALLAEEVGAATEEVLAWDLSLFDVQPPAIGGLQNEFVCAPRMDNQAMCHASLLALLAADEADATQVVTLYDHEEVGSGSAEGAGGGLAERVLRRISDVEGPGARAGDWTRAAAVSMQVSADMAHAVHPNWSDRHEPEHMPRINGGPVIKVNRNQKYATNAGTEAYFARLCQEVEVPYQKFVNRSDLACGSTIGPITAARLGIETVDVGNPMLSMHSIRETGGTADPEYMVRVMTIFLGGRR